MIKISRITKEYNVAGHITKALDDVSLELRDNEFVAVLGPSGSGKTTLLNIIGGLDHYDAGDLIISGKSTKHYKDGDWDTYRNHTIGFVFQSYNLIPHQTILSNVELALTISGVSRAERKRRALRALEQVGLGDRANRRPAQLSGGQMQRVAIARALVNNPDVILADEPTGALDSKTSVQVMELLKEVAKDRLVVMVTHNPELADEYANRIVKLHDGKIVSDSNPYDSTKEIAKTVREEKKGRARMTFATALSLSFNNLLTKKGRTILTAFAGSIGIIGIALILSISQGFQNYMDKIQEDTLTEYPLTLIAETTDMTSMLLSFMPDDDGEETAPGTVNEKQLLSGGFSSVTANDLASFKGYIDTHEDEIYQNVSRVQYSYSINPLIYAKDETDKIVKLNPSDILSSAFSSSMSSLVSSYSSFTSIYNEMTDDEKVREESYEVLAGRLPEAYDELVIVLPDSSTISDLLVYGIGLRDTSQLREMLTNFMSGKESDIEEEPRSYTYEELMSIDLRLINADALYKYNSKYDIYEDYSDDEACMQRAFDEALRLKVVGIVTASGDGLGSSTTSGVLYTKALTDYVREEAKNSEIVQKQLANEDIDVFSGKEFGEENESESGLDFEDMISIDEDKLKEAFDVKISADSFSIEMPGTDEMQKVVMGAAAKYAGQIASGPSVTSVTAILTGLNRAILSSTISGYEAQAAQDGYLSLAGTDAAAALITVEAYKSAAAALGNADPSMAALSSLTSLISDEDFEKLAAGLRESFNYYYAQMRNENYGYISAMQVIPYTVDDSNPSAPVSIYGIEYDGRTLRSDTLLNEALTCEAAAAQNTAAVNNVMNSYTTYMIAGAISESLSSVMTPLSESLSGLSSIFDGGTDSLFSIDTDKFAEAFTFDMDEDELSRLMTTLLSGTEEKDAESNLVSLGYQDPDDPTMISIYFKDFASKEAFMDFLDNYNETVPEKQQITYTDITGILMSSVSTIVDAVSYVLICFVSVSLIVSSIMIAVITLISVMERTKEIGILRAMGASKGSVASIFNAETFIIGLLSGIFGIAVTTGFIPIINAILYSLTGNENIKAVLPTKYALILIGISVILTVFSGLIPSGKASKNDPVTSLRSE